MFGGWPAAVLLLAGVLLACVDGTVLAVGVAASALGLVVAVVPVLSELHAVTSIAPAQTAATGSSTRLKGKSFMSPSFQSTFPPRIS